jgi:ATP-dependent helicase YprA (DUF1998 family)
MSIFDLHQNLISEYEKYVQSFFSISDDDMRLLVAEKLLGEKRLWPEGLLQLSPSYEQDVTVDELVARGRLHPLCKEVFRRSDGTPLTLYKHQREAIEAGLEGRSFIVTSGTGSGKSLTFLIPIFNTVISRGLSESKVRAILVYPMNALVNSQYRALHDFAHTFKERTGSEMPVRFAKYTGQERDVEKTHIQNNPPHVLLTNYVMLELMLVRPAEQRFTDQTTSALQFLVFDELHTYRGRQGADVALLIRRLRERCGNPNLVCVGTSATMVAGKDVGADQRKRAVAMFGSRIFGVELQPDDIY